MNEIYAELHSIKANLTERPLARKDILKAQEILFNMGLYEGKIDGILGKGTRAAVRKFQFKHKLPADGYVAKGLVQRLEMDNTSAKNDF